MTRWMFQWLQVAVVGLGLATASTAFAGPAPSASAGSASGRPSVRPAAQVQYDQEVGAVHSVQMTPDGGARILTDAPGVRVEKLLYQDHFVVTLTADRDRVEVRAAAGSVSVRRGRRSHTFASATVSERDLDEARKVLQGSRAVRAFRVLAAQLEERDGTPLAESVLVSGGLIGLLDGDLAAPRRIARKLAAKHRAGLRAARTQSYTSGQCWNVYSREANQIMYDFEDCTRRASWNPIYSVGCSVEFTIRAESNWFWFLSCNGGIPTRG